VCVWVCVCVCVSVRECEYGCVCARKFYHAHVCMCARMCLRGVSCHVQHCSSRCCCTMRTPFPCQDTAQSGPIQTQWHSVPLPRHSTEWSCPDTVALRSPAKTQHRVVLSKHSGPALRLPALWRRCVLPPLPAGQYYYLPNANDAAIAQATSSAMAAARSG